MNTIIIAKAAQSVAIDFDALPEVSKTYFIEYGMRQALNDATAPLKREDYESPELFRDAAMALVNKRLDGILKGELRTASSKIADPLEAETMRLAVNAVASAILKKGGKLKDYKLAALREKATPHLETFRAQAEANIAAQASTSIDIEV